MSKSYRVKNKQTKRLLRNSQPKVVAVIFVGHLKQRLLRELDSVYYEIKELNSTIYLTLCERMNTVLYGEMNGT